MGKDNLVKLAAIANCIVAIDVLVKDVRHSGVGEMNWIPLASCALLFLATIVVSKLPFKREDGLPKVPDVSAVRVIKDPKAHYF